MVFGKPLGGDSNRPHDALLEIGPSPHIIMNLAYQRIEEQAVDREVAALGVFFRR